MRLLILTLILGTGIFLLATNTSLISDAVIFFTVGATDKEDTLDPAIMLAIYVIAIIAIGYIVGFLHGKAHSAVREHLKKISSGGKRRDIAETVVVYEKSRDRVKKKRGKKKTTRSVRLSLKDIHESLVPFLKSSGLAIAAAAGLAFKFLKRHSNKAKEKAVAQASLHSRTTWPQIVYAVKAVGRFIWRGLQALVVLIEKMWAWFKDPS